MYDSGYNEIFAEKIMERWQVFDDTTKILVAVTTASSSAAAGLAIWSLPVFKQLWIFLAAAGVILSGKRCSSCSRPIEGVVKFKIRVWRALY